MGSISCSLGCSRIKLLGDVITIYKTVSTNCLVLLLGLLALLPSSVGATAAHCSPNAITQATVYTNMQTKADTFISFSYDVNSLCYPGGADKDLSIALVTTTDLYGANTLDVKSAMEPNAATSDANVIWGINWMSSSVIGVEADNWTPFYFDLRLARVGNPGLLEILLTETKGGGGADEYEPTDGPVVLGYGSYSGNRLSVLPTVVRVYLDSGPTLTGGTNNYALILRATDGDAGNHVIWRTETGTANVGAESPDSGVNWNFIAGGEYPHVAWYGQTLGTGAALFSADDILVEYLQDRFVAGERTGGLYWPIDITPTSGHDTTIPNYKLIILNKTDSPTEPDAVYNLSDACQIVRVATLPAGFKLGSLTGFADQDIEGAKDVPFLNLFMGKGGLLATNVGLDATAAFLLLGIVSSLVAMVITAKFFQNTILILLVGMLPLVPLTMANFIPEVVLVTVGLFVALYISWRTMVKSDV